MTCAGQYYKEWLDDIEPVRSYQLLTGGSFVLHLILSIRLYFEKKKVAKFETEAHHQRGGRIINFGGLKMAWVCLFPLALQIITIGKLDRMSPDMLNNDLNYWLIYFTHIFNQMFIAVLIIFVCYSKTNLRRAFKDRFFRFQATLKELPRTTRNKSSCSATLKE